jgi:hypothetical protein
MAISPPCYDLSASATEFIFLFYFLGFFFQVLGRFRIVIQEFDYPLLFELDFAGVVDSGIVSIAFSESLACESTADSKVKFRPIFMI